MKEIVVHVTNKSAYSIVDYLRSWWGYLRYWTRAGWYWLRGRILPLEKPVINHQMQLIIPPPGQYSQPLTLVIYIRKRQLWEQGLQIAVSGQDISIHVIDECLGYSQSVGQGTHNV